MWNRESQAALQIFTKKIVGAFNKEKVIVGASFRHCETSRPLTALLPIMEEMTRTEINIPVQSREEGAVATSSCNHEDSGNTPQRRTQMWYLARQLRSQAGGHKIWAAVDKVLTSGNLTLSSAKHHIWSAHFQLVPVLIPTPPPPLHSPRVHYNPGPVEVTNIASYWVCISTLRLWS